MIVCVHMMLLLLHWVRANIGQPQIMCTRSRVVTLNQIIQIYSNETEKKNISPIVCILLSSVVWTYQPIHYAVGFIW